MALTERPEDDGLAVDDARSREALWRTGVGSPALYDAMASTQFALLHALGLREGHYVADVGCGSMRVGRLLVPFLEVGHYFGVEPRELRLQAGIDEHLGASLLETKRPSFLVSDDFGLERFGVKFDYVLAQSIFSHTFLDLAQHGLAKIAESLATDGILVATFVERAGPLPPGLRTKAPNAESGWYGTGGVPYTWREMRGLLGAAGLVGRPLRWWHHRQTWFVAARPAGQDAMKARVRHMKHRLFGAPRALRVAPGITARLGLRRALRP